ncbi:MULTISPECIES: autotransporter outer membrane beta-barrel domain-containing protein [unclassified Escherichia]|uniref:autotransporter outer membrane beta-barrel domain-containing protein n=1 Tax=unclassified Escherichia TaxID=2608889 RepID=UPI0010288676|nr:MULTISPECIES: autotransporter outer membrane beta-barrel domain-containing protein [unclassified Escherichia]RZM89418.1 autotransporter outer membrane beta-barrel domain-containing protein [Escherichia sp. E1V33]TBR62740.1 autotransporter outer membrane beta-barrel domain-containing protein [Escherichia sp. E1S7]
MKLKKIPGVSLGLIALAMSNAYAEYDFKEIYLKRIENEEINQPEESSDIPALYVNSPYEGLLVFNSKITTSGNNSHAISARDGGLFLSDVIEVYTSGDGSYGISVDNAQAYIRDVTIKTTGNKLSDDYDARSSNGIVSEEGGRIIISGNNSVTTTGTHAAGLLSQVNNALTDTELTTVGNIVVSTTGNYSAGVLACSAPGDKRGCTDAIDTEPTGHFDTTGTKAIVDVTHGTIETSGENSYGAYANGLNAEVKLSDVDILTNNEGSHALAIRGGSISVEQSQINTANKNANIAMIYNGGELTLKQVNANSTGASISVVSASSLAPESTNDGDESGIANIKLEGSTLTSLNDVFIDNQNGNASITATASEFNGSAKLAGGTTTLTLSDTSIWYMNKDSVVTHLTNSDSIINLSHDDGQTFTQGKTLTVKGNYVGNNGQLNFRTVLGDDQAATDRLIVEGNTSGTTTVYVKNAGGSGAATLNGIELITVNGDESPADAFRQGDARIAAGAFEYQLKQQGKNWYLTSYQSVNEENNNSEGNNSSEGNSEPTATPGPVLRPEGGSYVANIAAANTMFVMRLNDRAGETRYIDPAVEQPRSSRLWLRQIGGHNAWRDSSGQLKTTSHRYVSQLGGDLLTGGFTDSDSWRFGLMAGYARHYNSSHSSVSDYRSKGSVRGYSVGVYATWFADDFSKKGAYVDAWAQYSWFKNSVKGDELAYESYSAKGATASLEAGYGFALNQHVGLEEAKYEWILQPQLQAIWMGVDHDVHTEANGTRVENNANNNIQTRLGFRTFIRTVEKNSGPHGDDFEPFVEMNWIHNSKNFAVSMNGVKVEQDGARNLGEIKLGVNGNLNPAASVWGNVGVQLGDNGYNDTAVMVGFKYKF